MANRLASEKSPYLLQHKDNPVDWYPWGPEAFARAKAENKPILLSIGYSTCHWCHVMEHESFSVPAVAEAMNRDFVCIKVDREERPDVDKIYMTAVQAMIGQGGWSLNAFLTPDLKPFYGGTYFPPDSRYGRPSWTGLLERLAQLWKDRRADVENDAESLARAVAAHASSEDESRGRPEADALETAERNLRASFDAENAGFGEAPKFPMPANLRFLLRRCARTGGADAGSMAVETLRAMTRGGIFDQLGGGYARYSTDHAWRIPHFEKMLYDNAQLLECLADAWTVSADPEILRALERTVAYLKRDLRAPGGGFYSAEDADSLPHDEPHGRKSEGAFYLWRKSEIEASLGKDARAFCERYGVVEGSNAFADPHGEFAGKCVLYDKDPKAMPEADAASARAKLFAERAKRPRPSLDDKILASWNGLAIAGLARAFGATGDAMCLDLAEGAADFVRRELASPDGKTLWRRWRDGERAIPGMADDYACMAYGLLALYEASFNPEHLQWGTDLAREALRRFAADGGGLYQTAKEDGRELFTRTIEDHDGVEPAPGSVLADVCLRLHELTGEDAFRRFADETLERFGPRLSTRPLAMPFLLAAWDRAAGKTATLLVADADLPGGAELVGVAREKLRPGLVFAAYRRADKAAFAKIYPLAREIAGAPRARAYLCVGRACGLPTENGAELRKRLEHL
ncbi:MAG: thioredoxin domain-containing protein [Elusimicrobia bacterium]|nr:thioredoxin domain-containing protein [Elusimicrobiota bacterium]